MTWAWINGWFSATAILIAEHGGKAWFFALNLAVILGSGLAFGWSETWQLWATTAITILNWQFMILILLVQARDMKALQLKNDELIRAIPGASDRIAAAEDRDEQDLDRMKREQGAPRQ